MRCGTARDLLPLLLDGALQPSDHRAVEAHLKACQSCHRHRVLLEELPPSLPSLPEGLRQQFFRDLDRALERDLQRLEGGMALPRRDGSVRGLLQRPPVMGVSLGVGLGLMALSTIFVIVGPEPVAPRGVMMAQSIGGAPAAVSVGAGLGGPGGNTVWGDEVLPDEVGVPCVPTEWEGDEPGGPMLFASTVGLGGTPERLSGQKPHSERSGELRKASFRTPSSSTSR